MRKKMIIISILLFLTFLSYINGQSVLEDVFYFHLTIYRNDTVTLDQFEVIEGVTSYFPGVSLKLNYSILLLSTENNILFREQLPINFVAHPMPPEGQPEIEVILNESEQYLRLPYFENADRIEIYHDSNLLFTYKICKVDNICEKNKGETNINCPEDCKEQIVCGNKKCEPDETQDNCCKDCGCPKGMKCVNDKCVSEKCGDGSCDKEENYKSCPKDCYSGLKDGYCDGVEDGLCDPDCSKDQDIDCGKGVGKIIIYVVIGVVIAILLFIILTRSRREA